MVGKESESIFYARVSSTADGRHILMISQDDKLDFNARSGFFVHAEIIPELKAIASAKKQMVTGTVLKAGKQFVCYLDKQPGEFTTGAGKLRYDVSDCSIVGYEIPEEE